MTSTLEEGQVVELEVSWPALLNDVLPLKLVAHGRLVRIEEKRAVIAMIPLRSSICDRTDDTLDRSNTNKIWLSRKTHRDLYVCMANFAMEPARAGRVDAQ